MFLNHTAYPGNFGFHILFTSEKAEMINGIPYYRIPGESMHEQLGQQTNTVISCLHTKSFIEQTESLYIERYKYPGLPIRQVLIHFQNILDPSYKLRMSVKASKPVDIRPGQLFFIHAGIYQLPQPFIFFHSSEDFHMLNLSIPGAGTKFHIAHAALHLPELLYHFHFCTLYISWQGRLQHRCPQEVHQFLSTGATPDLCGLAVRIENFIGFTHPINDNSPGKPFQVLMNWHHAGFLLIVSMPFFLHNLHLIYTDIC